MAGAGHASCGSRCSSRSGSGHSRPETPLNPVIHGRLDQGDYTVEKVYFESMPGFFVTGSLFRPKGKSGKCPGVLCPHGHWANGRFYDCGPEEIKKQIVQGAERFADSGRSPLQARCVQLARMGCVVFHYDMIGYADSQQISQEIIHGFKTQRPEMNQPQGWGLFSPQAESHLQSAMGLQTWNSIRALDFILSLPDVDRDAHCGDGSQRRRDADVRAQRHRSARAGGVSRRDGLDRDAGRLHLRERLRPAHRHRQHRVRGTLRTQTARHDRPPTTGRRKWPPRGFPNSRATTPCSVPAEQVKLVPLVHFDHNYNYVSRAAMYSWFNTHLKLGWPEPVVEEDFHRLTPQELTVWDDQHPQTGRRPRIRASAAGMVDRRTRPVRSRHCGLRDADSLRRVPGRRWRRRARHPATAGPQRRTACAGSRSRSRLALDTWRSSACSRAI